MNGNTTTNKGVIFLVVGGLIANGTIGMSSLAYCLVFKVEPNTALLTAFVGIVNYILGAISGMLVKTAPTETTKQPLPTAPQASLPANGVTPVQVVNPPTDPVPTVETPK